MIGRREHSGYICHLSPRNVMSIFRSHSPDNRRDGAAGSFVEVDQLGMEVANHMDTNLDDNVGQIL